VSAGPRRPNSSIFSAQMPASPGDRMFQGGNVQLDHLLHGSEDTARDARIWIGQETRQNLGKCRLSTSLCLLFFSSDVHRPINPTTGSRS
jgi:hypothetical protein